MSIKWSFSPFTPDFFPLSKPSNIISRMHLSFLPSFLSWISSVFTVRYTFHLQMEGLCLFKSSSLTHSSLSLLGHSHDLGGLSVRSSPTSPCSERPPPMFTGVAWHIGMSTPAKWATLLSLGLSQDIVSWFWRGLRLSRSYSKQAVQAEGLALIVSGSWLLCNPVRFKWVGPFYFVMKNSWVTFHEGFEVWFFIFYQGSSFSFFVRNTICVTQ